MEEQFILGEGSFALETRDVPSIPFGMPLENVYFNYEEYKLGLSHFNSIEDINLMLEAGLSQEESFTIHRFVPIALIETYSPSKIYISCQPGSLGTIWMDKLNAKGYVQIFPKLDDLIESLETVPNSFQFKQ